MSRFGSFILLPTFNNVKKGDEPDVNIYQEKAITQKKTSSYFVRLILILKITEIIHTIIIRKIYIYEME